MSGSAALSLVLVGACSDQGLLGEQPNSGIRGVPDLALWPEVLIFEDGEVGGEPSTEYLTVQNVGEELLAIDALDVTGSLAFEVEFEPFALEPGDELDVPVHFVPTAVTNIGVIWVESNDPDAGRVTVELEGAGLTAALEIDPVLYDFGSATTGCDTEGQLTLRSYGGVPVTVTDLTLLGEQFSVSEALPIELGGDDEQDITVVFHPEVSAAHEAELFVTHTAAGGTAGARLTGLGNPILELEELFWQGPFDTTDVFIHVDRSCSMADDAANLASNFDTFADTMNDLEADWRVGVVTADHGCHNGAVYTADTPDLASELATAVAGPSGDYTEKGIHLIATAMAAACNVELMREGARTAVIYLSDEPDQSPATWDTYLVEMYLLSPSIVTHAIVDSTDAGGYEDITAATGGLQIDIRSDWGADLGTIASETIGEYRETFPLSEPADPDSVRVEVDGLEVTAWTLSSDHQSITFDAAAVPRSGQEIRVEYTSGSTCSW